MRIPRDTPTLRKLLTAAAALAGFCAVLATTSASARAEDEDGNPDSFDLLGYFPTKGTAGRIKPYQLRLSYLWGPVNYTSVQGASDAAVTAGSFQQGFRAETDRWFQIGSAHRRNFGVMADFQHLSVSPFDTLAGPSISYTSASVMFGYRVFGFGHFQAWIPELTVQIGPALEYFPTMTVALDSTSYKLSQPQILGTRAGARFRTPILPALGNLSLEIGGYYTKPMKVIDSSGGTVDSGNAQSYGGTALVDVRLFSRAIFGFGLYIGHFDLRYTPTGAATTDQSVFDTQSFLGSVRVSF